MYGFVIDEQVREKINSQGENYWDVYWAEINNLIGARGKPLSLEDLENESTIVPLKTIVVGFQSGQKLSDIARKNLALWVQQGGLLIGCGLSGMDEVFGIQINGEIKQTPDDYAITGCFELRPHPITHEVHPFLFTEQKLLILSDIQTVNLNGGIELARLHDADAKETSYPAVVWNVYGKGFAGYFSFDIAKTVWLLHQGKPTSHISENRFHPRPPDMMVIGKNSTKIPYADEICFIMQNMIAQSHQPFIYQLPPKNGRMADALLYWGGDEYVGPTELSLEASNWMRQQGLPYHINIQENHPMTPEEFHHITVDNGHEISLFYHTEEKNGFKMTEEMYLKQSTDFEKKVGYRPCVTVNSVTRWNHWARAAKWMLRAGGKADNSFVSNILQLENPLANGPVFGFAFGTSFPFYFYDDFRSGNKKIEFMEQPIICYEIGHRGSLLDHETEVSKEIHFPLEMAIRYHMTMNLFYHPVYIAKYPNCKKAIQEILNYIQDCHANVVHMGNNALADWWEKRSKSSLDEIEIKDNTISFNSDCRYEKGMVVKFLLKRTLVQAFIDSRYPADYEIRKEFAGSWLFLAVPFGNHSVKLQFA